MRTISSRVSSESVGSARVAAVLSSPSSSSVRRASISRIEVPASPEASFSIADASWRSSETICAEIEVTAGVVRAARSVSRTRLPSWARSDAMCCVLSSISTSH